MFNFNKTYYLSFISLRAGQSGNRIPVGARFFVAVQTGSGAHPASYTMRTGFLSREVKRPGRGVDHPPPSSAEVKDIVELYLYSTSGASWPVVGRTLPLPLSLFHAFKYIFLKRGPYVSPDSQRGPWHKTG
jgi:hypothetical protein